MLIVPEESVTPGCAAQLIALLVTVRTSAVLLVCQVIATLLAGSRISVHDWSVSRRPRQRLSVHTHRWFP